MALQCQGWSPSPQKLQRRKLKVTRLHLEDLCKTAALHLSIHLLQCAILPAGPLSSAPLYALW